MADLIEVSLTIYSWVFIRDGHDLHIGSTAGILATRPHLSGWLP